MTLHTDIPSSTEVRGLLLARDPASVSIYLATEPAGGDQAARIELESLGRAAVDQLRAATGDPDAATRIAEALEDLVDDDALWSHLANSLAVFVTPSTLKTFRLPNRLGTRVEVADRFHVKPLLRSVTFPQAAFVLALAQGSVRLFEIGPEGPPSEVLVDGLPADVASSVGKSSVADRAPTGRLQGSEGKKVRIRQYARQIDQALRSVLTGLDLPLILAATEPLESIFRSVNTYPHLAETGISGSPESRSDVELAAEARTVLDELYERELHELRQLFERRASQSRATTDTAEVARAATFGAVDTVFVDIDATVPGSIDEVTGRITLDAAGDAANYGVLDEIARRVLENGGRVLAVRADDILGAGPVAAILRYPLQ